MPVCSAREAPLGVPQGIRRRLSRTTTVLGYFALPRLRGTPILVVEKTQHTVSIAALPEPAEGCWPSGTL